MAHVFQTCCHVELSTAAETAGSASARRAATQSGHASHHTLFKTVWVPVRRRAGAKNWLKVYEG